MLTHMENDYIYKKGEMVRMGMLNALDTVVMTASPSWKYRMDNGSVLDVDAFTNRELGDDSYWIDKDDSGERGHDLAVSLVLDCSGSMAHNLDALSASAYGIHGACRALGIPSTVSIFGSEQYLLWDHEDQEEAMTLPSLGGTTIAPCLHNLPDQRLGKTRHVVIILTDGEWEYEVPTLQPFMGEGIMIVLVGLGMKLSELTKRMPTRAITINDITDLPKHVELVIGDFFR